MQEYTSKKIYLLDTNIISEPLKLNPNAGVMEKLKENGDFCCISAITWYESMFDVNLMTEGKRKERTFNYLINKVQAFFPVVNFDQHCAFVQANIQAALQKKGIIIPEVDLFIASTAIANNLILITHNTKDFENIPDLMIEDWFKQ